MQIKCFIIIIIITALSLSFFVLYTGIRVLSSNAHPTVTQGQHADLTCQLSDTQEDLTQISWQKKTREYNFNHNFYIITPTHGPSPVNGRQDRVSFIGDVAVLVGSIRLENVSLSDEGVYTCIFTVFPSGPQTTEIHLSVQGKRSYCSSLPAFLAVCY